MEFLILLIGTLLGTIIGWRFREYYAQRKVMYMLQELEEATESDEEVIEDERTKIHLEKHGDFLYAYEVETGTFVAQGKDLYALDEAVRARYPERKFSVQEQNLIDIKVNHESV